MKAIISTSLFTSAIGFRSRQANAHLPTGLQPQQVVYISSNNAQSYLAGSRKRSTSWYKPYKNTQRHASYKSIRALSEAQPTTSRVHFDLNDGQSRLFHTLPSGMKMEVIVQRAVKNGSNENQWRERSPVVFVHGSFHAAWCWAVHWLPFFAGSGHDCYAVSLLGQVTFSLAAKAFATSLSLCRETFFSRDMSDLQVERYQELLKNSSSVPLFDLRKLNAALPVPLPPEHAPPVLVMGATDDFIVDVQGLNETAEFYNVSPVIVEGVAHDMMLDISWKKGSRAILSWLELTC